MITSEATYHLNLATLINSFMDDLKMDPTSTDSDHVMDRTQHSTIFSNVKEIREVSTRYVHAMPILIVYTGTAIGMARFKGGCPHFKATEILQNRPDSHTSKSL